MKVCSKCNIEKESSYFSKDKSRSDGLSRKLQKEQFLHG